VHQTNNRENFATLSLRDVGTKRVVNFRLELILVRENLLSSIFENLIVPFKRMARIHFLTPTVCALTGLHVLVSCLKMDVLLLYIFFL